MIRALLAAEPAPCTHGRQLRDFLYVGDAALAMAALLDSELQGPVNIASGEAIALKDLALHIGEQLGRSDLIELGRRATPHDEPPVLLANVTQVDSGIMLASRV